METLIHDWVIASTPLDDPMGSHGVWRDRTGRRHCQVGPDSQGSAEAAVKGFRWLNEADTASKTPDAMDAPGEQRRLWVAGVSRAWETTRAKNVGCARWRMKEKPGAFGADVVGIVVGQIAAVAHCSDSTDVGSCSETRT